MPSAIFTARVSSDYDDLVEERYHFPDTYLRQVRAAVGHVIVYYEPRRSGKEGAPPGRQAYFATALVKDVIPDHARPGHHYARVEDFLPFPRPVPFFDGGHFYESSLRRADGGTSKGAFGRAVRELPAPEFRAIVAAGHVGVSNAELLLGTEDRPRVLQARAFRDRAFTDTVRRVYENACAITGLRVVNGGGWTEAQAAHIRPVEDRGPDSIRNALLLSSTMHAVFDHGFLSVSDDYRILVARDAPEALRLLLPRDLSLRLPERPDERPHPSFLRYHRESRFRG